jgi:ATP-dependent helicase/DNAse subunit B
VTFGPDDADFAPWSLKVDGVAVEIEGKIDRLDAATDGRVQVVDYKLRGARFEWWKFLAGAQLQLPLYLRVAAGWQLAEGQELEPFQALFKGAEFSSSGNKLEFSATPIPGKQCETGELLRALLAEVDCIVAELVRGILQLEFPPRPLRSPDEKWTACKYCDFRPLCRFDPQAGEEFETLEQVTHNDLCEELAGNADPKLWRHLMGKGEAAE